VLRQTTFRTRCAERVWHSEMALHATSEKMQKGELARRTEIGRLLTGFWIIVQKWFCSRLHRDTQPLRHDSSGVPPERNVGWVCTRTMPYPRRRAKWWDKRPRDCGGFGGEIGLNSSARHRRRRADERGLFLTKENGYAKFALQIRSRMTSRKAER
jgi:hypothetical protein